MFLSVESRSVSHDQSMSETETEESKCFMLVEQSSVTEPGDPARLVMRGPTSDGDGRIGDTRHTASEVRSAKFPTVPPQYIISPSAPLLTEPKIEKTSIDCCLMSAFRTVGLVH